MEPRKGRMAELDQERIEQQVIDGERRYYDSIMHDELSNDIDFNNSEVTQ